MSLSKLSAKCRACPFVDTCDHKEMEAYGFLPLPTQQETIIFSEPSEEDLVRARQRDCPCGSGAGTTVQIEFGENGRYLRVETFFFTGSEDLTFSRSFVKVGGKEYELIRNFQCEFLCELRSVDESTIFCCLATEHEDGKVEVIAPKYLTHCGTTFRCQHICQRKKDMARNLIGMVRPEEKPCLLAILDRPLTIELNQEALSFDPKGVDQMRNLK